MKCLRRAAGVLVLLGALSGVRAGAYSVLSHEEVVDMVWKPQIVPLLRARFPGISDDAVLHAHAYAYGGAIIQDMGYYPFGSHYFSDLLHYVRTGDFVGALIRDSTTPDEYAFALGALAHYCGDTVGHPFINRVTAKEYPALEKRYGDTITYEQASTAHLRTEFGFDAVGVARGFYTQDNYRDFIGFQVAKPLLERAFQETYGMAVSDVIKHEDLAISTYRFSVSTVIPKMTKVALASYHDEIEHAHPGFERDKFLYRFQRTEFQKTYGVTYQKPGFGTRVLGVLIAITPKVGPFKALRLSVPNGDEQTIYIKSVNETVDRYKVLLAQVKAEPMALPAEVIARKDAGTAEAAKQQEEVNPVSAALASGAAGAKKQDQDDAIERADVATQKAVGDAVKESEKSVAKTVQQVKKDAPAGTATPTVSLVHADAAAASAAVGETADAAEARAKQPVPPAMGDLDMDTGRPTAEGEYRLADETYARLLDDLTKDKTRTIPPSLRRTVLKFYEHDGNSDDKLKQKPKAWRKVEANLKTFRTAADEVAAPAPTGGRD